MIEKNRLFLLLDQHNEIHLLYVKPLVPAYALVTPEIAKLFDEDDEDIQASLERLTALLKIKPQHLHIVSSYFPRFTARWFCKNQQLQIIEDAQTILQKGLPLKSHLFNHLKNTLEQFKQTFRIEELHHSDDKVGIHKN